MSSFPDLGDDLEENASTLLLDRAPFWNWLVLSSWLSVLRWANRGFEVLVREHSPSPARSFSPFIVMEREWRERKRGWTEAKRERESVWVLRWCGEREGKKVGKVRSSLSMARSWNNVRVSRVLLSLAFSNFKHNKVNGCFNLILVRSVSHGSRDAVFLSCLVGYPPFDNFHLLNHSLHRALSLWWLCFSYYDQVHSLILFVLFDPFEFPCFSLFDQRL